MNTRIWSRLLAQLAAARSPGRRQKKRPAAAIFSWSHAIIRRSIWISCSRGDVDGLLVRPVYEAGYVGMELIDELLKGKIYHTDEKLWGQVLPMNIIYPGGEGNRESRALCRHVCALCSALWKLIERGAKMKRIVFVVLVAAELFVLLCACGGAQDDALAAARGRILLIQCGETAFGRSLHGQHQPPGAPDRPARLF